MKKTFLLSALALALAFTSGAGAQMMGNGSDMTPGDEPQQTAQAPQDMPGMMYPGMMGGCRMGMGSGMMGGYGMGPRMMEGYGMGPGTMGNYGYGMGPGMRDGNCDCRRHMHGNRHGYGMGRSSADREKFGKFLDETRELRKKLYMLRFDYREMLRNPETTLKEKMEMEKKMFDLGQQIQEKAAQ